MEADTYPSDKTGEERAAYESDDEDKLFYLYVEYGRALRKANRVDDAEQMYRSAVDMLEVEGRKGTEGDKTATSQCVLEVSPEERALVYHEYADLLTTRAYHLEAVPLYCKAHALLKNALFHSTEKVADTSIRTIEVPADRTPQRLKRLVQKRRSSRREKETEVRVACGSKDSSSSSSINKMQTGHSSRGTDLLTPAAVLAAAAEGGSGGRKWLVLTEASCASLAAACATFLFYPLEVLRTRTQAQTQVGEGDGDSSFSTSTSSGDSGDSVLGQLGASVSPLLAEYATYAVFLRVVYIFLCSFLYVFLFESLKKRMNRVLSAGAGAGAGAAKFSWLANFCCSGVACLLTVLLTQAVDSNIYRNQANSEEDLCGWSHVFVTVVVPEEPPSLLSSPLFSLLFSLLVQVLRALQCEVSQSLTGVLPSLFLCLNPALYFTLFDGFKWKLLKRQQSGSGRVSCSTKKKIKSRSCDEDEDEDEAARLSGMQAFWLGFLCKALATLLTYPFIRAKVLLITHSEGGRAERAGSAGACLNSSGGRITEVSGRGLSGVLERSAATLLSLLLSFQLFRVVISLVQQQQQGGGGGAASSMWQGLGLHLVHACLRDACSMVSLRYTRSGIWYMAYATWHIRQFRFYVFRTK